MKLEDKNFEEEFIKWLNSKSKDELIEMLKKYESEIKKYETRNKI